MSRGRPAKVGARIASKPLTALLRSAASRSGRRARCAAWRRHPGLPARYSATAASRSARARRPAHRPRPPRTAPNRCRRTVPARTPGNPFLFDIVAQAQHHARDRSRLVAARAPAPPARRRRQPPSSRAPARCRRCVPRQAGNCAATEQIGIEHERGAVEHQLVLPADLIEIDQRQPALGDARHRDRQPHIALVALR